ncbi:extensin [Iris pallida]|uniref:Extensin n=1 Tax=Iris pallida TaxID=29817 RepID=A0AAX6GTW2_IRIPA|nr:extensin [Iris pallida]
MAFPPSSTPPQRPISAVSTWPPWKTCHHLPTVTSTITKVQLSYSASTSWRPRQTQQPSSIVFCVCVRPRVRPRVSAPHFFSSYYITDYKLLVVSDRQTQQPSSIVFCVCVRPRVRPRVSAPHFFSSYYITDYKLLVVSDRPDTTSTSFRVRYMIRHPHRNQKHHNRHTTTHLNPDLLRRHLRDATAPATAATGDPDPDVDSMEHPRLVAPKTSNPVTTMPVRSLLRNRGGAAGSPPAHEQALHGPQCLLAAPSPDRLAPTAPPTAVRPGSCAEPSSSCYEP